MREQEASVAGKLLVVTTASSHSSVVSLSIWIVVEGKEIHIQLFMLVIKTQIAPECLKK